MASLATDLLERAQALGLQLRVDGADIVIRGHESPDAVAIVAAIREHKPEVFRLLGRCCAPCYARNTRPDPLGDGCGLHAVTAEAVADRWQRVTPAADPAVCVCCAGPTLNLRDLICRTCSVEL